MSEQLSAHVFYNLDEDLPGWAVFEHVQPLFAMDLPWVPAFPKGRSSTRDAADEVRFDTSKRKFRAHITALPSLLPDKTLSEPEFRVCKNALKPLLCFLDSIVSDAIPETEPGLASEDEFDADIIKKKRDKQNEVAARMAGLRLWASLVVPQGLLTNLTNLVSWAYTQAAGSATSVRRHIPGPVAVAFPAIEGDDDASSPKLDNLRALGKLIQRSHQKDLMKTCKEFIRFNVSLDQLEKATNDAGEVGSVFASTSIPQAPPDGQEITDTNWEELRPWQLSCQLFYLLRERTCRPLLGSKGGQPERKFHDVKLQLDGFLLDSVTESLRLDVFLSSCPSPPLPSWQSSAPPSHWRQGWYTSVNSRENKLDAMDLCVHTAKPIESESMVTGQPVLKMFFQEGRLYHDEWHEDNHSVSQESAPTMSLADLLEKGVLLDPFQGGLFTFGDKAILSLSLARCLLHLFRGSWMHELWTANNVHFLHKEAESEDWIFDIHHPYVTCSLAPDRVASRPKLKSDDCQRFLSAFAKLLLEIEIGSKIDVDVSLPHESFKIEMWRHVRNLEVRRHVSRRATGRTLQSYIQAIHGCINFSKALMKPSESNSAHRQNGVLEPKTVAFKLEDVRRVIYTKVVKRLETHFASFPTSTTVFHTGGLFIPKTALGAAMAILQPCNTPGTSQRAEYRRIDYYQFFGFSSQPTSTVTADILITAQKAEEFSRLYRQFRRRFIIPYLKKSEKPQVRVRICLLDTGIDLKDEDLNYERRAVKQYRLEQGFEGHDLDPIKRRESFQEGTDTSTRDTCGHGTHLALLLLRYAPDADIYIGKVSSEMQFQDKKAIVKAIEWATCDDVKADIITMSFGRDLTSTSIHQAIKDSQRTTSATGHTPLLFAAASNHGLLKAPSFPASDANVICVYALDGEGFDVHRLNPPTDPFKPNFGTLGHAIDLKWSEKDTANKTYVQQYKSGTSYATPILAATTANYLAWLDCHATSLGTNKHKHARESEWIIKVFRECMATKQESKSDMMFVAPWNFYSMQGWDLKDSYPAPPPMIEDDQKTTQRCLNTIEGFLSAVDD